MIEMPHIVWLHLLRMVFLFRNRYSYEYYTAMVVLQVAIQHTFTEDEVCPDPDGEDDDYEPTLNALDRYAKEFMQKIKESYLVDNVEVVDCEVLSSLR